MPILKISLVPRRGRRRPARAFVPAWAVCDGCVVAAINAHKAEMIRQFSDLKTFLAEQFKTLRQSIAQVEKDSLRAQADIAYRPPARACETATAGAAVGPARDRAEAYHRAFNHLRRPERTGAAAARRWSRPRSRVIATPRTWARAAALRPAGGPTRSFRRKPSTRGRAWATGPKRPSPTPSCPEVLSFDDDRITDARRFIDNAADPYPTDDLPKALRETPQGKRFWLRRKLYEGRLSASRYSLNHALAWRAPAAALKGWLLAVWQESKAAEHQDELIAALPENISYLEL